MYIPQTNKVQFTLISCRFIWTDPLSIFTSFVWRPDPTDVVICISHTFAWWQSRRSNPRHITYKLRMLTTTPTTFRSHYHDLIVNYRHLLASFCKPNPAYLFTPGRSIFDSNALTTGCRLLHIYISLYIVSGNLKDFCFTIFTTIWTLWNAFQHFICLNIISGNRHFHFNNAIREGIYDFAPI